MVNRLLATLALLIGALSCAAPATASTAPGGGGGCAAYVARTWQSDAVHVEATFNVACEVAPLNTAFWVAGVIDRGGSGGWVEKSAICTSNVSTPYKHCQITLTQYDPPGVQRFYFSFDPAYTFIAYPQYGRQAGGTMRCYPTLGCDRVIVDY